MTARMSMRQHDYWEEEPPRNRITDGLHNRPMKLKTRTQYQSDTDINGCRPLVPPTTQYAQPGRNATSALYHRRHSTSQEEEEKSGKNVQLEWKIPALEQILQGHMHPYQSNPTTATNTLPFADANTNLLPPLPKDH